MTQHRILNSADHRDLRIHVGAGAEFGDAVMASLVVPPEFRRLACEYPILFRYDGGRRAFTPLALFGFEPGENLFLAEGGWDAANRPLAMSVQPFLIGRPPGGTADSDAPSQVHIDMGHPRISTDGQGVRVFDDAGAATPFLEEIADRLGALDQGYRATAAFCAALDRYDLLEPFSMDVALDDGSSHRLVGYHLIHEERLRALDAGVLAELHRDGHLEPIYMALAALGNLGKLVRRKNRRFHG